LLWSRLPLEPAPIWHELTPLVLAVIATSLVAQAIALFQPRSVRAYEGAGLLLDIGILALAGRALAAGPIVVVTIADSPVRWLAVFFNLLGSVGLTVWAVVAIGSIAFGIYGWVAQAAGPVAHNDDATAR
jgi:hypothetical protein